MVCGAVHRQSRASRRAERTRCCNSLLICITPTSHPGSRLQALLTRSDQARRGARGLPQEVTVRVSQSASTRQARPQRPSGSGLRGLRSRDGGTVCAHRRRVPAPPRDAGGARAEPGAARASAQPEPEVAGGRARSSATGERGFAARPRSRNPRSREDEREDASGSSAGSVARPRKKLLVHITPKSFWGVKIADSAHMPHQSGCVRQSVRVRAAARSG